MEGFQLSQGVWMWRVRRGVCGLALRIEWVRSDGKSTKLPPPACCTA